MFPRPIIHPNQAFPIPSYYHSPLLESLAEHTDISRGYSLMFYPFSSTHALTYVKFGESRRIPYFLAMVACLYGLGRRGR